MTPPVATFEPQPLPDALPQAFPSPFDELGPHPLARRAAEELNAWLRAHPPDLRDGGKMFGVLVVRDRDGRFGWLRAFSGMLAGTWDLDGFVPPVFDRAAREALEPAGEKVVKGLHARTEAYRNSPELQAIRDANAAMEARHAAELAALRLHHEQNRRERRDRRAQLLDATPEQLHTLDQESRRDKAERRRLEESHEAERRATAPVLARMERRLRAHERLRRLVSRAVMRQLHDTYVLTSARGDTKTLRQLFTHGEPPSGAGDCAGPKLLAFARAHALRPIALAEFWWGPPPATGGRIEGAYYPACREKCAPILPHLLDGLEVAPPRVFVPPDSSAVSLKVLYEDRWLVVLDKPHGLLSVPARDEGITDSVLARLRRLHPDARGPLLAHRLDLDTSGLLVAGLDLDTYVALQRQFTTREVRKRYVALLEGRVEGERGTIDFPIRVDLHDRPRQIHDPVHGKRAVTEWEVLARVGARTRVALYPLTGRTHQLRVHAAHPLGLGAPIVGDRLYGHEAERLHLHAELLELTHPATGARLRFESAAPF